MNDITVTQEEFQKQLTLDARKQGSGIQKKSSEPFEQNRSGGQD